MDNKSGDSLKGGIAAASSFIIWGLIPMYWKLLESVNAYELVLHRIAWSFLFLLLILRYRGRLKAYILVFRDKRLALIHAFGGLMLAINWLAFIYAVTNGQILQASLAYFIVPLVNLGFGFIVLKEGLTRLRALAVLLACVGVLNEVFGVEEIPWLALTIAGSFGSIRTVKKEVLNGNRYRIGSRKHRNFPNRFGGVGVVVLTKPRGFVSCALVSPGSHSSYRHCYLYTLTTIFLWCQKDSAQHAWDTSVYCPVYEIWLGCVVVQ